MDYFNVPRERNPMRVMAVVGVVCLVFGVITVIAGSTSIEPTEVGVPKLFGKLTGEALDPGYHFVNPFAQVVKLYAATYQLKETMAVPSKGGLSIALEASLLYSIERGKAPHIFERFGTGLLGVIESQFRSDVRNVCASRAPEEVYAGDGAALEQAVEIVTRAALAPDGIVVERVLIRDRQPPQSVKDSIEAKNRADQESQRMAFTILKEKQEAERKKIEAQGIADFQKIVTEGITPTLLEWKALEVTHELTQSPNSKIVVVGRQKDGLPIILDTGK